MAGSEDPNCFLTNKRLAEIDFRRSDHQIQGHRHVEGSGIFAVIDQAS